MIEAQDLVKHFGPVRAVDGVSLVARDGRITGLLGPNGAGKSTTLRLLTSILQADQGRAAIDGIDLNQHPGQARRHIGTLPHNAGLYPHLSGAENIAYFGRLCGLDEQTLRLRLSRMIDAFSLQDFADRPAKDYSQGQRTRIALARAIIHEPANLLLDEPMAGLDVMATRGLRQQIRQLRDAGRCVLISSHVMQEVAALCDDIVIIASGRVAAAGTPDQIRQTAGHDDLEDAFVKIIGSPEGLE
ncbi:MAG: ATP-binding cassette domain-containing protein [Gammaproteobacteria bacterium]